MDKLAPLLEIITIAIPSGRFESPLEPHHVVCFHLGDPVHVSCRMEAGEQRWLQSHGQFCVVPVGATPRWLMEQPLRKLLFRLPPSLFQETADAMGLRADGTALVPALRARDPHIERIGWMLQAEDSDAYPSGRLFADSLASALASRLLCLQSRHTASASKTARALPARRLRNVLEYIDAHLNEDLGLAELAAVAGYSLSHFKPLFKQAVGIPVHRFVLERRVERARTLLLQGRNSMLEIALEAGFAHPSHMARCVRRTLGVTPSQLVAASR